MFFLKFTFSGRFKRMLEYKEPPPYSETDKQMIPDRQPEILNGSIGFSDIRGSNLKSRMRKRIEDLENEKVEEYFFNRNQPIYELELKIDFKRFLKSYANGTFLCFFCCPFPNSNKKC